MLKRVLYWSGGTESPTGVGGEEEATFMATSLEHFCLEGRKEKWSIKIFYSKFFRTLIILWLGPFRLL